MPVSLPRARTSLSTLRVARRRSRPGKSPRTGPCRPSCEETVEKGGRTILPSTWGSPVPPRQPASPASWGASRYAGSRARGSARAGPHRSSRSLRRWSGPAVPPAASVRTRPSGQGRDRSGLPGSTRTRQTGYGSSWDHFFASCRKQQGPPTMAPLHITDDEPPAGSDTTLRDTPSSSADASSVSKDGYRCPRHDRLRGVGCVRQLQLVVTSMGDIVHRRHLRLC